jgi:thiamine-monophosphate kinase
VDLAGKDATPHSRTMSTVTIDHLTERELIARIQRQLAPAPDWLIAGIGDDAAVVEPERNRAEVLTVDAVVEGIHFDRAFVPPDAIGHRALAVNLSDLAAMGATPRLALFSCVLPADLLLGHFDEMVAGLVALASTHRIHVVGGNMTRSPGPLMIDVTATGHVKRRQALMRRGARPGDAIYVSGSVGAANAGLQRLSSTAPEARTASAAVDPCTRRYLYPDPRVRLGLLLSRNRAASACVDLSDGLADGLHRIAESSEVGMAIDPAAIPIEPDARAWFDAQGSDAILAAITGGDDYELLFTVRPRTHRRLTAAVRHGGVPLTRIGVCTADRAMVLRGSSGSSAPERELPRVGYDHFR